MNSDRALILLFISNMLLAISYVGLTITHARERRDLLNRIMAKDLPEYAAMQGKAKAPKGRNIVAASLKRQEGHDE